MTLFHAKYVEQAKFLFTAFHKKAVGVKQQYHGKKRNHTASKPQYHLQLRGSVHLIQTFIPGNCQHNVVHGPDANGCCDKGQVQFSVFL